MRQLAGTKVEGVARHPFAQQHALPVRAVQVWLVRRPAPVEVVEVEARRAEVRQGVEPRGAQRFPQPGRGVESEVMVGELAQVGVAGRYLRVLLGIALALRYGPALLLRGHRLGQQAEIMPLELGALQFREQPDETAGRDRVELIGFERGPLVLVPVPPCAVV